MRGAAAGSSARQTEIVSRLVKYKLVTHMMRRQELEVSFSLFVLFYFVFFVCC